MNELFSNEWTKRAVSLFSLVYGIMLGAISYMSFFYNVQIENGVSFLVLSVITSVFFLVMMIYTRKQIITRIVSIVALPLFLPILLFYFGEWLFIVPFAVVIIIMFFVSGAGEATKTILGTLILLLYVIGAVAYFLATTFLGTRTQDVVIQVAESDSKLYRSYVVDTIDSSTGGTKIYVEPNDRDKNFKYMRFIAKGYKKQIYNDRNHYNISMEWDTVNRSELMDISKDVKVDISADRIEFFQQNGIISWTEEQVNTLKAFCLNDSSNKINYVDGYGLVFTSDISNAAAEILGLKRGTIKDTVKKQEKIYTHTFYYALGLSKMQRSIFEMPEEGDCELSADQIDHIINVAVMPLNADQRQAIYNKLINGGTAYYYDECDKYPEGAVEFTFPDTDADQGKEMGLQVKTDMTVRTIEEVTENEIVYYPLTLSDEILDSIGMPNEGDVLYITAYDNEGNIVENSNGEKLDRMLYFRYDEAAMNRWFAADKREFEFN